MATIAVGIDAGEAFVYVDKVHATYKMTIEDDSGTSLTLTGTYSQIEQIRDQIFAKLADAKHS